MNLLGDIKHTFRGILQSPGSSFLVAGIMAIGLGVSLTIYSFANGIMWNDLGLSRDKDLVFVNWPEQEEFSRGIHIHDYEAFEKNSLSFEGMTAFQTRQVTLYYPNGGGYAEAYDSATVLPNFFDFVPQKPIIGRVFREEDVAADNDRPALISQEIWRDQFNNDPDIIGTSITLNNEPSTVIGVMPSGFGFPTNMEVWWATDFDWLKERKRGTGGALGVLGYLKPDVTFQQAAADLNRIAANLAVEFPESNADKTTLRVRKYENAITDEDGIRRFHDVLAIFLAFGALVLLVSCANVSNLMMARAARRSFELAVRNSMGASKRQVMYQVILDGAVLTLIGAVFGMLIAAWGSRYIDGIIDGQNAPYWWRVELDSRVVAAAVLATTLSSLIATLIPAVRSAKRNSYSLLRDDSRTSTGLFMGKLSKLLVGFQIMAATCLTISTIFAHDSVGQITDPDLSYEMESLITATANFNARNGFENPEKVFAFEEQLLETLAPLGATSISLSNGSPIGTFSQSQRVEVAGRTFEDIRELPRAPIYSTTPGYFDTYNLKTLAGDRFTNLDTANSRRVAVISSKAAEHIFDGEDPINKSFRLHRGNNEPSEWITVIGVCDSIIDHPGPGRTLQDISFIYLPLSQNFLQTLSLTVRAKGNSDRFATPIRQAMSKHMTNFVPINTIRTNQALNDFINQINTLAVNSFFALSIAAFVIAGIGLYAVATFSAVQRQKEYGIRLALGGKRFDIFISVLKQYAIESSVGILLGTAFAAAMINLMTNQLLDGIPTETGFIYVIVIPSILATTIVAILHPALKAAQRDPSHSMRVA